MKRRIGKSATGVAVIALGLGLVACAPSADKTTTSAASAPTLDEPKQYASAQEVIDSYDVTKLCGDKPLKLAFPTGIANPWMKDVYQMILNESKKCPNIQDVQMVDAQVDQQKSVSDVNSLVAQGVNGIVTLPIFGQAQIPSFRNALKADVPVVTFIADSSGKPGTDVTAHVSQDLKTYGQGWADWLDKNLEKGTVVFLGGAPGQPSSSDAFKAFSTGLAQYPDLKLVESEFQPTNNSTVEKKRVMTGLLAKHGRIDAVVTDAGAYDTAVLEAYKEAGMKLPFLANANSTNGVACSWQKENFPLFSWDGSQSLGVVAFRHMLAAVTGAPTSEPLMVKPIVSIDTIGGVDAKCDSSMSPDVDWSVTLTDAELRKVHS